MSVKEQKRLKQKISLFEEYFKEDHLLVHLDGRDTTAQLPQTLRDNPALVLKLSALFQGTTTHDETAITAYLRFDGNYQECILPWKAVWGLTSSGGRNAVWPEDMPKELLLQFVKAQLKTLGKKVLGRDADKELREKEKVELDQRAEKPKEKKKGFHLRRVK